MERFVEALPTCLRSPTFRKNNLRTMLVSFLSTILIVAVGGIVVYYVLTPVVACLLEFCGNVRTAVWYILLCIVLKKAAVLLDVTCRRNPLQVYEDVVILTLSCFLVFTHCYLAASLFLLLSHLYKNASDFSNGSYRKYGLYEDVVIPTVSCFLVFTHCYLTACLFLLLSHLFKKASDFSYVSNGMCRKYALYEDIVMPTVSCFLLFSHRYLTSSLFLLISHLYKKDSDFANGTYRKYALYEDLVIPTVSCFLVFTHFYLTACLFLLLSHLYKKSSDFSNGTYRKYALYEDVFIPAVTCLLVRTLSPLQAVLVLLCVVSFKKAIDLSSNTGKKYTKNPRPCELYELRKYYTSYPVERITWDNDKYFDFPWKHMLNNISYSPRQAIEN